MYYVIVAKDVGPNERDSHGDYLPQDGELFIQTVPGEKNLSHEPCTEGWLGTTNGIAVYAHGEFDTLEAAQATADDLGFTEVDDEFEDDNDPPLIIERRLTPRDARQQWDAGDWLSSDPGGLTANTSDAELTALAVQLDAEALAEDAELHGLGEYLRGRRTAMRQAAVGEIEALVTFVFASAFHTRADRSTDPGAALVAAREAASQLVPAWLTGTFDDEDLDFTADEVTE